MYVSTFKKAVLEESLASARDQSGRDGSEEYLFMSLTSASCCSDTQSAQPKYLRRVDNSLFTETAFIGGSSSTQYVLTFQKNRNQHFSDSNFGFANGDLLVIESPSLTKDKITWVQPGIVVCSSTVAVAAKGTMGKSNQYRSDEVCVLVNCGSSQTKANLFDNVLESCLAVGSNERLSWTVKIVSNLTTSSREYQAITSLQYLDNDIQDIVTKGVIHSTTSDSQINFGAILPMMSSALEAKHNVTQMKAIRSAIGRDRITLIQGPVRSLKNIAFLFLFILYICNCSLARVKQELS